MGLAVEDVRCTVQYIRNIGVEVYVQERACCETWYRIFAGIGRNLFQGQSLQAKRGNCREWSYTDRENYSVFQSGQSSVLELAGDSGLSWSTACEGCCGTYVGGMKRRGKESQGTMIF